MTRDKLRQASEARRFFLGEMSAEERGVFEETFVADEGLFEQVRAVEDELVEAYVRGALAPAEREKFERSFLTNARRRGRVEFTRAMLGRLAGRQDAEVEAKSTEGAAAAAHTSVWDSVVGFFKTPALAFGAAIALLLLTCGVWLSQREATRTEVSRGDDPIPTPRAGGPEANAKPPANGRGPAESNANKPERTPGSSNAAQRATAQNKVQNSNARKRNVTAPAPVLALSAGVIRGGGKISELTLPRGAAGANLQLNLESQHYKIYRVEIVNPDGAPVFRSNNLKARNLKIRLFVPAEKLARGDYLVKLSALNARGEIESVADYSFRVSRR